MGTTGRRQFGSLRRLSSGRWQARYTAPNGKTIKAPSPFARKADGEAWLVDRRRERDNSLWNPQPDAAPEPILFCDYAPRWITERRTSGRPLRPRTKAQYERILAVHLLPRFGNATLASIKPQQVRTWYADLLPDAPGMRAQTYGLLHAIMASAVSDELIDAQPCRIRGAGQARRVHIINPATVAELDALTELLPEHLRLTVPLASWCSLRHGEMAELRRGDLDLGQGIIRVRRAVTTVKGGFIVGPPKSEAGIRDVHIPPHIVGQIEDHLANHVGPEQDALLFHAPGSVQKHLRQSTLFWRWSKARAAVGRADLRWHDLRHTGGTMTARTGATTKESMGRLGHSTPEMALRYQHVVEGRDAEIAHLLSKMASNG